MLEITRKQGLCSVNGKPESNSREVAAGAAKWNFQPVCGAVGTLGTLEQAGVRTE